MIPIPLSLHFDIYKQEIVTMTEQIDNLDKQILAILHTDARKPYMEIARELNVARATVHSRINRMREDGIITGSKIMINHAALGYGISAFVGITLYDKESYDEVKENLEALTECMEIHTTTGAYNLFIRVLVPSVQELHQLLTGKMKIKGVQTTETFLILDTYLTRDLML
jgi:Lrp/AsnC family transcriptional regulator for asnA, asnC and gidA